MRRRRACPPRNRTRPEPLRLPYRDAEFLGAQLRRWRGNPPAATARTVWLREQIGDLVPRGQPLEHVSPRTAPSQRRRCVSSKSPFRNEALCRRAALDGLGGVSVAPVSTRYEHSLRPCQEPTIAPRRRGPITKGTPGQRAEDRLRPQDPSASRRASAVVRSRIRIPSTWSEFVLHTRAHRAPRARA